VGTGGLPEGLSEVYLDRSGTPGPQRVLDGLAGGGEIELRMSITRTISGITYTATIDETFTPMLILRGDPVPRPHGDPR